MAQVNPDKKWSVRTPLFLSGANGQKGIYNMILQHGTIHTMAGNTIEQGYILIQNGIIQQIGQGEPLDITDEDIIDLKGAHVYPGFIDAHTHLGIFEDGLNFEGDDCNEDTEPITPHLRAIDAINPMEPVSYTHLKNAALPELVSILKH